jgi:hypothetical protein
MEQQKEVEKLFLNQLAKYILDFGYYVDEREHGNLKLQLYSTGVRYYEFFYNSRTLVNIREIELEDISLFYSENIYTALKLFHNEEKREA